MKHLRFFKMTVALVASLLSAGSTFAQGLVERTFHSQDFEGYEERMMDENGRYDGNNGGYWEFGFHPDFAYGREARLADGIGNPGKAIEAEAGFSYPYSGSVPLGRLGVWNSFHPGSFIFHDSNDPETQVRLNFDLWTSETSPVRVITRAQRPSQRLRPDWSLESKVTNDEANTWQSHVIDFYAFGLTSEDRVVHASLYEGFTITQAHWDISSHDWGNDNGNIFRIDNVKMSIIPEPSEYALMIGLGLMGFVAIRQMRIKIS